MSRIIVFQKPRATNGDIIQFIPFVYAFYAFESLLFYNHYHCEGDVIIIPSTTRIHQGDLSGGALFTLDHFKALCSTFNHFPSCLFPSIVNDTHFISLLWIVSSSLWTFCVIIFSIQPQKCVTWSPSNLPPNFNTPS